ncbi:pyruvate ferredoxin oxidoreductase [Clostridium sp. K25]|uniref:thiamine pyrophosphate-dependent enzyme n=1 Tax=Clostridium TaxID=1485 RepID=UPI0004D6557F|nr:MULTISPECIES: thiamine pyrophosphate-dependent enzyme [Clostridium]KEI09138.1 pyruvate ferredoxin oxidoreductase [Clostridium sp. K25]MCD3217067.1 pyruvate ferredoxin oxidoreductase [Clostridium botulinum C]
MATLRELTNVQDRLASGHRMCAGCGAPMVAKWVLKAIKPKDEAVIGCATGCLEVSTGLYPYSSWNDSFIHTAFECASATVSGVEAAYRAMKARGSVKKNYKFITFGGDGGTYDIGFQSLSGAMERGHDMLYVCYDNGAYMNTGIQRSSATPCGADATTSPCGSESLGKQQFRKDLTMIMAGHHIPYVAQTVPVIPGTRYMLDLYNKSHKAINEIQGPKFINVLTPCPRGWRVDTASELDMIKLAVDTCFWPLYEVIDDKFKLNYKPVKKLPIEEWMKPQGRFKHLFKSKEGKAKICAIQAEIDKRWEELLFLCGEES